MLKRLAFAGSLALALTGASAARAGNLKSTGGGHVAASAFKVVPGSIQTLRPKRLDHDQAGRSGNQTVRASWYGGQGERLSSHTANGERFNPRALTAAHRTLPFGTRLRVTFRGRSVVVRVNDRGPSIKTGRTLDLSYGAAKKIGMIQAGFGAVKIERIDASSHWTED